LARALALAYTRATVKETRQETYDTVTYSFELGDGRGPADFLPGQFNMLYIPGVGEVPISIASSRDEPMVKHTIRSVGCVTSLISGIKVGDVLGLRGPFGTSWPLDLAYGKELVIVAGGCGLAPLRPVIQDALANADKFKGVKVLYGAKTPGDLFYTYEYDLWSRTKGGEILVSVDKATDDAEAGSCAQRWSKNVGVVTTLLKQVEFTPHRAVAFICGPEIMMKFTVADLLRMGLSESDITLSLERNMNCGRGTCGHCQMGPLFICRDGPVFPYVRVKKYFAKEGV
jgi:NAD(P)H-flavin reductase